MTAGLAFDLVEQLAPRIGRTDVPCPLCPTFHNPRRRVLRIWRDEHFAGFHCVRCGEKGLHAVAALPMPPVLRRFGWPRSGRKPPRATPLNKYSGNARPRFYGRVVVQSKTLRPKLICGKPDIIAVEFLRLSATYRARKARARTNRSVRHCPRA